MQALTSLFARNFGTPNYAAHGGFCSVNMAAGMIYTIGGSFWEFGGPDLERAKLFVMIGTAEDHHSNPLKIAISKFKRQGGRFVSINPVRTGYSAIADEWIPIKPGTDGALLMALLHVLIASDRIDHAFLKRFTNAPQLVLLETGCDREGMFAHDPDPAKGPPGDGRHPHNKLVFDRSDGRSSRPIPKASPTAAIRRSRALHARRRPPRRARVPAAARAGRAVHARWAAAITGIAAERIVALAHELGTAAFEQAFELPIAWTDAWGKRHPTTQGRPVAFHAMRGLAAHSNGFQTVRALAVLMSVLGTIDAPGRLSPQGAVSAPHRAELPRLQLARHAQARHAAQRRAARLSGQPRGAGDRRRRHADADRPRVLLGASALGARPDAHRHHPCQPRRPVPARHADDLHGQHGLELDHEHHGRARDAEREGRDGEFRSPSSSSATRSRARRSPSPTWCCPTPPTSSGTTR
jgi:anaerobic selenocysteine-containing dehydrogenase